MGTGTTAATKILRRFNESNNVIVVTRHPALVEMLYEDKIISPGTPVIDHATPDDVRGKDVIGILPLHLACLANSVMEIPLDIPREMRGRELDLDTLRSISGEPVTYKVEVI